MPDRQDDLIYIDEDEVRAPSTLRWPGGSQAFPTFQEAIRHWYALSPGDIKDAAWITIDKSGRLFHSWEMAWIVVRSTDKPPLE